MHAASTPSRRRIWPTVLVLTTLVATLVWSPSALADPDPEFEAYEYPLAVVNPCSSEPITATVAVAITRHRHNHTVVALVDVQVVASDGSYGAGHETVVRNTRNYNRHLSLIMDNEATGDKWRATIDIHARGGPDSIPISLRCINQGS